MLRHVFRSPFTWMMLSLGLFEVLAGVVAPYRGVIPAGAASRNEDNLRGWPEYVAASSDDDSDVSPLVVLVSNSQGLAREFTNPAQCYPAILADALAEERPGTRLENWSVQGLRTNELEVLALEAEAQGAELLVIAVGYKNFEHPHLVMLDYGASDVDLLAGQPHLWHPLLKSTVTGELTDLDDLLVRWFQLLTDLGRWRRPLLDRLGSWIPEPYHDSLFGHRVQTQRSLSEAPDGGPMPPMTAARRQMLSRRDRSLVARKLSALSPADLGPPAGVCRRVIEALGERSAKSDMAVLWVWVPMETSSLSPETARLVKRFNKQGSAHLRRHDLPAVDLVDAIPAEEFITIAHLDRRGHGRMAQLLLAQVLDALP